MNLPKPELSKQEALQLWNTYHSEYAKEQMILANYGIVFSVMQNLSIPVNDEDMFQTGIVGLLKAINTFDSSKGYNFSTYAFTVVRNELLMSFRKSKKSVRAAFSLDDNVDIGNGESVPYAELMADGRDHEKDVINSMLVQQIFGTLNFREKRIFIMFFVENKTQCEISKEMKLSQSYVSRIIKNMGRKAKHKERNTI
jgi:RNA polymerase sporulation-specific sigma factor